MATTNNIDMRVDLDTAQARAEIEQLKRAVSSFASDVRAQARDLQIKVTAQAETARALAEIATLKQAASGIQSVIDVSLNASQALTDLALLRSTPNITVAIRAEVSASQALTDLTALRTLARDMTMRVEARVDTAAALAQLAAFRTGLSDHTIRIIIDASGTVGAQGALDGIRNAVLGLGAAIATTLPLLRDFNDELNRMQLAARAAAAEIRRAAEEQERLRRAGGGGGGGGGGGAGGVTGWRLHALAVANVAQEYSGLSAKLLATKSAMAVLSAATAGLVPHLTALAGAAGMAFATFASTAHIAGVTKEMQSLSDTTGMTTQSLREMQLLSGFSGMTRNIAEFGESAKALEAINTRIMEIGWSGKKNDDFRNFLDEIGIDVEKLRQKKPDEVLLMIDAALKKTNATAREQEHFFEKIAGKGTADLIPLLQQQNAELDIARKYMRDVGAIQSDAQVAAMAQTNKELSLFKIGLEGVATRLSDVGSNVVNTLGPNIRQLFIDAKKPIAEWSNDVDVALKKFKSDLDRTGSWTVALKLSLKDAYPTLYGFVASAADFGRGYGQAFITPMLNELKRGYASISSSLGAAGGAEKLGKGLGEAMLPVVGIVHNVTGAIKILIDNWQTLKTIAALTPVGFAVANWDKVTAVFTSVGNGIKTVAQYFGLITPATAQGATGMQMFTAALIGLVAAGASTRIALGAVGAAFSVIRFAIAPAILAVQLAPAVFGALAAAAGVASRALQVLRLAAMLNPVVAGVTAVAAVGTLLVANWDKVSPFFSKMWGDVTASFNKAFAGISSTPWQQMPQKILSGFASFAGDLYKIGVTAIADLAKGLLTSLGVSQANANKVGDAIYATFVTIPKKLWDMGVEIITKFASGIISAINAPDASAKSVAMAVINAYASLPRDLYNKAVEAIGELALGIAKMMGVPEGKAREVVTSVVGAFITLPDKLWEMGSEAMGKLASSIASAGSRAVDEAKQIARRVVDAVKNTASNLVEYGKNAAEGLAKGITEGSEKLGKAVREMAGVVDSGTTDALEIQSPSRLMMRHGGFIAEGLALGITNKSGLAVDSARSLSAKITNALKVAQPDFKTNLPTLPTFSTKPQGGAGNASNLAGLSKDVLSTHDAYRALTGSVTDYGLAQDQAAASTDGWGSKLTETQKLSQSLGQTLQQHVIGKFQALAKTGNEAVDSVINKLIELYLTSDKATQGFNNIFSGVSKFFGGGQAGGFGSGVGGFVKSLLGFAQGASFAPTAVQTYANGGAFHNSILTQLTPFMTAKGQAVAGEAGPEAVMPLIKGNRVRAQMPDGTTGDVGLTRINGSLGVVLDSISKNVSRYATGGTFNTTNNSYSNASNTPKININITNNSKNTEASQSESVGDNGDMNIDVLFEQFEARQNSKIMRGDGLARLLQRRA